MSEKTVYRIYFQDLDGEEHTEEVSTEEAAIALAKHGGPPPVRVTKVTITESEEEIFRADKDEVDMRVYPSRQSPIGKY
jgi:hypothetical protein